MEYLSTKEAAKEIGCSRQYVWILIKMKKLKAHKVGNAYIIYKKHVEEYLK